MFSSWVPPGFPVGSPTVTTMRPPASADTKKTASYCNDSDFLCDLCRMFVKLRLLSRSGCPVQSY